MTYGLISELDGDTLEKTLDIILKEFPNEAIRITEVGLFNCATLKGMKNYVLYNKREVIPTGIDNEKDKPIKEHEWLNFIKGNSNEVYNQLEDNSQHLIFIDACHCFSHVISDFYCYADKVKVGGFIAFHDTGKHIKPFKDFQHGDKNNPDAYISVRKALDAIGLPSIIMKEKWGGGRAVVGYYWEQVFDEADENDEAGGVMVFRKLKLN